MKATVVGAAVPAKTLRAACTKAEVPSKDVRVIGTRAWVDVAHDTRDVMLARLAEALGTGLMVVDVDLPQSTSGEGLQASRATYRGVEEDVTAEARALLDKRLADGRTLDPETAALEGVCRQRQCTARIMALEAGPDQRDAGHVQPGRGLQERSPLGLLRTDEYLQITLLGQNT